MSERLTRWEGRDEDGPRAVLAKRDGSWVRNMGEALRKLAMYEDEEEQIEQEADNLVAFFVKHMFYQAKDEEERRADDIRPYEKDGGADDHQRG